MAASSVPPTLSADLEGSRVSLGPPVLNPLGLAAVNDLDATAEVSRIMAEEGAAAGINWSFTPENHYAHPSVGRREIKERDGRFFVETHILCQAQRPNCDRLRDDYALLDKRMNEAIQRDLQKKK